MANRDVFDHHPAPAKRPPPVILQSILQQHVWVRRVLTKAGTVAMSRLEGRAAAGTVAEAVAELRHAMFAHLAFEEGALLPILRDDLPLGPARAERLLDEHARQRAMLDALAAEASTQPHLPTLAAKLASLSSWLLADMAEEEGSLLVPEVVRDDQIVIDQSCG